MNAAQIANEIKSNIGPDFNMLDALDVDFLDTDAEAEAAEEAERAERQRINAAMAEWFGL